MCGVNSMSEEGDIDVESAEDVPDIAVEATATTVEDRSDVYSPTVSDVLYVTVSIDLFVYNYNVCCIYIVRVYCMCGCMCTCRYVCK